MKVKCTKFYNEQTKQYQDTSSWLTIGQEYVVLEILIKPEKEIIYRLVGDNKTEMPALYDARQFEIVSGKIPESWIIKQFSSGNFIFSPNPWRKSGFWENCYNGDLTALETYKREARIIYEEEGVL
ncbi:MAG: hypothetical protein WBE18_01770 [Gammaproteobacteria bacterium]